MKSIDRLAAIRLQQRDLRLEARAIRTQLLAGTADLVGDEHLATVTHHVSIRRLVGHAGNGVHEKPERPNGWASV